MTILTAGPCGTRMISRAASARHPAVWSVCGQESSPGAGPVGAASGRLVLGRLVLGRLSWAALSWAAATRSCSRARTSSGVYARRRRSARAATTPVAATPASPATPSSLHSEPHGIRCRDMGPKFAA